MPAAPRILVATDFSRTAQLAVARAARLAAPTGARLDIVHAARPVRPSLMAWLRSKPEAAAAVDEAQGGIDEAVAIAQGLGAAARGHVVTGAPVAVLEASCRRLKPGLVVLGAQGAHRIRDRLIGTTAERLIDRLTADVLVVRRPPQAPYRKLLVCVDISPAAARALRCGVELGPEAQLHVLHAFEPVLSGKLRGANLRALAAEHLRNERELARKELTAFLGETGVAPRSLKILLKQGHPQRVIERAVQSVAPDLIAVGHHSSALAQAFLGSVAKHVLRISACDVLLTHR
jgi:nucleotide-binding universal stress UspA family protein